MRAILLAASAASAFVFAPGGLGRAESELQKFVASVPRDVASEILSYRACAATKMVEGHNAQASFDEVERSIAAACKQHLPIKSAVPFAKTAPAERAKLIEQFSRLAVEERRLTYEGKPIPGYKLDPWVERTLACTQTRPIIGEINDCFTEQGRQLIEFSDEPAETIAVAVSAVCRTPQLKLRQMLLPCMDTREADGLVEMAVRPNREAVIAAVVQKRARERAERSAVPR
jgi:hypothetical protein